MSEEIFHGFSVIDESNIKGFKQGVWAMFGTEKENNPSNKITCLNVGKNTDVGKELEIDFKRLKQKVAPNYLKEYRNQFGELLFKYTVRGNRQDELYAHINNKYEDIITIFISDKNDYNIEKYVAYSLKSKYWVSNGKYRSSVDDKEIERIRQEINVQDIDEKTIKAINDLKDWYEQQ